MLSYHCSIRVNRWLVCIYFFLCAISNTKREEEEEERSMLIIRDAMTDQSPLNSDKMLLEEEVKIA